MGVVARLLGLGLLLGLAWAQILPPEGGLYVYSDGTVQALEAVEGGYRLAYRRDGKVFREDRLRFGAEGIYLEGVALPKGFFPFAPPLLLYPKRLVLGASWSGNARFQEQRVALAVRVEGVEGVRVPAGRFNAYRLRVAFTTERGGADVKLLYLVPGLGVVAFQAGEGLVGLVRFSEP